MLAVVDGILYFSSPTGKSVSARRRRRGVDPTFPSSNGSNDGNNQIYVIPNDLPGYEPPPSYFDVHPEAQRPTVVIAPATTQTSTPPVFPQQTIPPPPLT